MLDPDDPGVTGGAFALHPEVAAHVDVRPGRASRQQLLHHEVRRVALADAARVEPHPRGKRDRGHDRVDHDAFEPASERRDAAGGPFVEQFEAPVVARPDHVAEDRGVVAAAGDPRALQSPLHQRQRLRRDPHVTPGHRVELADLGVAAEPAPPLFEVFDQLASGAEQRTRPPDHDDVDVGAHGPEPPLSFHEWW